MKKNVYEKSGYEKSGYEKQSVYEWMLTAASDAKLSKLHRLDDKIGSVLQLMGDDDTPEKIAYRLKWYNIHEQKSLAAQAAGVCW